MKKYDYIIIGSGPAANHLLFKLARTDRTALVIENNLWGGTCPNTGCQPKIFLEGAVRPVLNTYYLTGKGVKAAAQLDWKTLLKRKKEIWAEFRAEERSSIESDQVDTVFGSGVITGPHTVAAAGEEYEGKIIVIATGLLPHHLEVPGSEYAISNDEFFDLDELPKKAVVIGGGYVALELATILQAAGSEVTVLQHSEKLLRPFDQEYVEKLTEMMEERGIAIHLNTPVKAIAKNSAAYEVTAENGQKFETDLVIDASGRRANVNGLGLEKLGIKFDPVKGVAVNEHLQTNVPSIFAAGDVADNGQMNLTPVAWVDSYHIYDFVENGLTEGIKYPAVATSTFTYPQVAQVGKRESEMAEGDTVRRIKLGSTFAALGEGDEEAELKVIFNKDGEVVGASEISINAGEDINLFAPLIGRKDPAEFAMNNLGFAFPTLANKLDVLFR